MEWGSASKLMDDRPAVLITSRTALKVSQPFINNININETVIIENSHREYVESIQIKRQDIAIAYLVGAGQVNDIGRYLSYKWQLPVISIPTAITADAFLVDCTGLRENRGVTYQPSKRANKIVLDWELLKKAPWNINVSGCGDVLSIFTGLWDWQHFDEFYDVAVATEAKGILDALISQKNSIVRPSQKALEMLVNCLAMEVQLCYLYGNSRPEEGGEHFFAYCIENKIGHCLHGEIVGFGILLTGFLQNQDITQIKNFMDTISMSYLPSNINEKVVIDTLRELPQYVREQNLRSSIYNNFNYDQSKEKIKSFFKLINL